jgi:hypothetical protein
LWRKVRQAWHGGEGSQLSNSSYSTRRSAALLVLMPLPCGRPRRERRGVHCSCSKRHPWARTCPRPRLYDTGSFELIGFTIKKGFRDDETVAPSAMSALGTAFVLVAPLAVSVVGTANVLACTNSLTLSTRIDVCQHWSVSARRLELMPLETDLS